MAIDTTNKKLALMSFRRMGHSHLPISPGTIGQDDQQQLLGGYPGILWGAALPAGDNTGGLYPWMVNRGPVTISDHPESGDRITVGFPRLPIRGIRARFDATLKQNALNLHKSNEALGRLGLIGTRHHRFGLVQAKRLRDAIRFRKTLSPLGTKVGQRQRHKDSHG